MDPAAASQDHQSSPGATTLFKKLNPSAACFVPPAAVVAKKSSVEGGDSPKTATPVASSPAVSTSAAALPSLVPPPVIPMSLMPAVQQYEFASAMSAFRTLEAEFGDRLHELEDRLMWTYNLLHERNMLSVSSGTSALGTPLGIISQFWSFYQLSAWRTAAHVLCSCSKPDCWCQTSAERTLVTAEAKAILSCTSIAKPLRDQLLAACNPATAGELTVEEQSEAVSYTMMILYLFLRTALLEKSKHGDAAEVAASTAQIQKILGLREELFRARESTSFIRCCLPLMVLSRVYSQFLNIVVTSVAMNAPLLMIVRSKQRLSSVFGNLCTSFLGLRVRAPVTTIRNEVLENVFPLDDPIVVCCVADVVNALRVLREQQGPALDEAEGPTTINFIAMRAACGSGDSVAKFVTVASTLLGLNQASVQLRTASIHSEAAPGAVKQEPPLEVVIPSTATLVPAFVPPTLTDAEARDPRTFPFTIKGIIAAVDNTLSASALTLLESLLSQCHNGTPALDASFFKDFSPLIRDLGYIASVLIAQNKNEVSFYTTAIGAAMNVLKTRGQPRSETTKKVVKPSARPEASANVISYTTTINTAEAPRGDDSVSHGGSGPVFADANDDSEPRQEPDDEGDDDDDAITLLRHALRCVHEQQEQERTEHHAAAGPEAATISPPHAGFTFLSPGEKTWEVGPS